MNGNIIEYVCVYVILVGFFLIEYFTRKGKETKCMDRTEFDKGSTTFVSVVMGLAFILIPLSPVLNYLKIGIIYKTWISVCGIVLGIIGLIIRYIAFSTLGEHFTRTLRKTNEHILITNGIYHYVRHPGYLSNFLIFIGTSLGMKNIITIIVVPVLFIPAYMYRIYTEEKMMLEIFGEKFIEYRKNTKCIIPFIY